MKKILFAVLIASAALMGRAEWLSWCVSDFDNFGDINESDISYMRVGYVETNPGGEPTWSGHSLATYSSSGTLLASDGAIVYDGGDDRYKVDVTAFKGTAYGFYIELLNENDEVIGRTGTESSHTYDTYEQLGQYISTGSLTDVPQVKVWHGTFQAVPEPSSMALLALGAGLVGLRRKLKKGKKGKRA